MLDQSSPEGRNDSAPGFKLTLRKVKEETSFPGSCNTAKHCVQGSFQGHVRGRSLQQLGAGDATELVSGPPTAGALQNGEDDVT